MFSGKAFGSILLTGPLLLTSLAGGLISSPAFADQQKPKPQLKAEQQPPPEVELLRLNPHSLDQYRTNLGITDLRRMLRNEIVLGKRPKVRVAILDRGFAGLEERIGRSIPRDTKYRRGPLKSRELTPHGTLMAEIVTSLVWGAEGEDSLREPLPFELLLYNVAGFSNLKAAVDGVIKDKVDLVLYSEVWELGGNGDGRGFINNEINRALENGVIWINAAGNFGGRTFNSGIYVQDDDLVELPDERGSLEMTCAPPEGQDLCDVKVTLNWNSFKDDSSKGTVKDLDLALFDSNFKVVGKSLLKQVDIEGDATGKESKYPRESISAQLKPGRYHIMVRTKQRDWNEGDRLRILVDGDSVVLNRGDFEESLQNPADNAGVITVGASDSDRSSASKSLGKPELMAPSNVMEWFGRQFRGSSNAAAIVMGKAILLKYLEPRLDREGMIQALLTGPEMLVSMNGQSEFYEEEVPRFDERVVPDYQGGQSLKPRFAWRGESYLARRNGTWASTPQPYAGENPQFSRDQNRQPNGPFRMRGFDQGFRGDDGEFRGTPPFQQSFMGQRDLEIPGY